MSRSLNAEFLLFLRIGMVKTFCIPIVWYLVFSGTVFSENIVAFSSNVSEYDNFTSFNSTEFPFNFTIEEEEGENETVEIETTQLNVEDGSQQATIPLPIPTAESQVLNLTSPEGLVTDYVSSLSYEKEIVKDEDRNVFVSSLESLDLSMENVTLYQTLHDDSEMCWSCNDTGKSDVDCRSEAKDIRECNEASHLNRTDGVCYLWHREATNSTLRGCLKDLTADELSLCRQENGYCKVCFKNRCNGMPWNGVSRIPFNYLMCWYVALILVIENDLLL